MERGLPETRPATAAATHETTPGEAAAPVRDKRAGRWRTGFVVHPFLLAAYPVVFLFAQNIREQLTTRILFETLALVLPAVAVGMLVLFVVLRDLHRAGLMTSVLVVLFFGFGHVRDLVPAPFDDPYVLLAIGAVLLVAGAGAALLLRERALATTTQALNVVATLLLAFNALPIIEYQLHELGRVSGTAGSVTGTDRDGPAPAVPGTTRDIYIINLDRYANATTLEEVYGFDNSEFLDELRRRGFYIASDSRANYLKSALSITSTLEMDYLDNAALAAEARAPDDYGPLYRGLDEPLEVQRFLKSRGYEYVHLGSWWVGTDSNAGADLNLRYGDVPEFTSVLVDTTALPALRQLARGGPGASPEPLEHRDRHREHALFTFDRLPLVAEIRGPKFVFAHLALPHEPYVFDRNGAYVGEEMERSRTREQNYVEQLQYVNKRTLEILDTLLAGPPESDPIIILYADEGPYPVRYAADELHFPWPEATSDELREKFGILNAYHLPGVDPDGVGLHPSISPVNSFRVVFNAYFGTDLPLLPDRQLILPDTLHLYDAIDATERLQQ